MFNPSLRVLFCACTCVIFLLSRCGDSTTVGSDIFSNEGLDVLFTDDTELIITTVRLDTIKTYNNTDEADACFLSSLPIRRWSEFVLPTHFIGTNIDPVFGTSTSSIYTEVGFPEAVTLVTRPLILPTFTGSLDSLVLALDYDTTAVYGDRSKLFDVEVYRVLENFAVVGDAAYNNNNLERSSMPIGSLVDVKYSLDSLNVILPGSDSSIMQGPGLRIPIDTLIGGLSSLPIEMFTSLNSNSTTESFKSLLGGLYITSPSMENIMPGIIISSSQLELYYTNDEGEHQMFPFRLFRDDLISFNHIESERDGMAAANAANGTSSDDLLYVSGQDGFDVHINFSDVDKFQNSVLNKAQLEFTLAVSEEESELYPPLDRLILSQLSDNKELICIADLSLELINTNVGPLFGGTLEEVEENGTVLRKYKMNITSHIQNYLNGITSAVLVLSVDNRTDNASRTVLYGPNHPTYPAKLNLTYTAQ